MTRYRQIASGSPQWPQAFYPMKKINTVLPGEIVTARLGDIIASLDRTIRLADSHQSRLVS